MWFVPGRKNTVTVCYSVRLLVWLNAGHLGTELFVCFWEISTTQGLNVLICFLFLVITVINERSWSTDSVRRTQRQRDESVPAICMSLSAKDLISLFITSQPDTANCTLIYHPLQCHCQANSTSIYTLSKSFTPHFITFSCYRRLPIMQHFKPC